MPYNGSGIYSAPSSPGAFNPATSGQNATPDAWNTLLADMSTAFSTGLLRNGTSTVTADIPFANHKLTLVADGTLATDAATLGQVQTGDFSYGGADVGAVDAYEVTLVPAPAAYTVGLSIEWSVSHANTIVAPTLKLTGLTPGTIVWPDGTALGVGDLPLGANVRTIVSALSTGTPTWQLETVSSPLTSNRAITLTKTLTMSGAAINNAARVDVASAATTNIGAAASNYVNITGATTITAFDTVASGVERMVRFAGALVLTHSGTLSLPNNGQNITTVMGDAAIFVSNGAGAWKCTFYQRMMGTALQMAAGTLVNRAYAANTTFSTITANIPADDSIPQVGEGTEILSVAITPQATTDRVRVRAVVPLGLPSGASGIGCVALFRNGGANAIDAVFPRLVDGLGNYPTVLEFEDSPGSISAQTYSIRIGAAASNVLLNGDISGRLGGGSSRATIVLEEIVA